MSTNLIKRNLFFSVTSCYNKFATNANPQPLTNVGVHPFRKAWPKDEVIQYLVKNVIYHNNGIIAFNKPAGLAKTRPTGQIVTKFGGKTVGEAIYVEEILEQVCKQIPGIESPSIVKFPERYTSGVMIVATTDEARTKMEKTKRRAKASNDPCDSYLAVSLGKPIVTEDSRRFAVQLSEKEGFKKPIPELVDNWSVSARKREDVKLYRCAHTVLASSELASLTQIALTSTKSNALRLYFATKLLSPLLGDAIFGSRVKSVLGVPMLIDPWSDVANSPPKIPVDVLSALHLQSNESSAVQLMVHLAEVFLPKFHSGAGVVIRAPPPPPFLWVCRQLGLPEPVASGQLKQPSGET